MSLFSAALESYTLNPFKPGTLKYWFHMDDEHRDALTDVIAAFGRGVNVATIYRILKDAYADKEPAFGFKLDTLRDFLREYDGNSRSAH